MPEIDDPRVQSALQAMLADDAGITPLESAVGHPPGPPPTDGPNEIIGEALVFAGANNRMGVVDYLVAGGADIDARPYLNTTALHLAIMFANPDAAAGLLERGASPSILDGRHHSNARGWAQACLSDEDPAWRRVAEMLDA